MSGSYVIGACAACLDPVSERHPAWRLCDVCGYALAGACLGKKRFTRGQAEKRAYAAQVAYLCEVCGRFHIGKVVPDQERRDMRVLTIIRTLRRSGQGWLLTQLDEEFRTASRRAWKERKGL